MKRNMKISPRRVTQETKERALRTLLFHPEVRGHRRPAHEVREVDPKVGLLCSLKDLFTHLFHRKWGERDNRW